MKKQITTDNIIFDDSGAMKRRESWISSPYDASSSLTLNMIEKHIWKMMYGGTDLNYSQHKLKGSTLLELLNEEIKNEHLL